MVSSNQIDEELKKSERLHRILAIQSSLLFFLGTCAFMVYVIAENQYQTGSQFADSITSKVTVATGYLLLSLHALIEMVIDFQKVPRIFPHSRYGRVFGTKRSYGVDLRNLNVLQSGLFLFASLLEMVAFLALFVLRRTDVYSWFNVGGSCLFLTSAALTLVIRGCCWVRWSRSAREMLDQSANGLFVVATVAWMFACLNQFENFHSNTVGALLQDMCMIVFFVCGFFYLLADLLRLCEKSELTGRRRPLVRRRAEESEESSSDEEAAIESKQNRSSTRKHKSSSRTSPQKQKQPSWANTSSPSPKIVTEKYSSDLDPDAALQQIEADDNGVRIHSAIEEIRTPEPSPALDSPMVSLEMSSRHQSIRTISSLSIHSSLEDLENPEIGKALYNKKRRNGLRTFVSESLAL